MVCPFTTWYRATDHLITITFFITNLFIIFQSFINFTKAGWSLNFILAIKIPIICTWEHFPSLWNSHWWQRSSHWYFRYSWDLWCFSSFHFSKAEELCNFLTEAVLGVPLLCPLLPQLEQSIVGVLVRYRGAKTRDSTNTMPGNRPTWKIIGLPYFGLFVKIRFVKAILINKSTIDHKS